MKSIGWPWAPALVLATAATLAALGPQRASAAPPRQEPPRVPTALDSQEFCLACHETPGRLLMLSSGEWLALTVDRQTLATSAHAETSCSGCHARQSSLPHRATPESRRDLMLTVSGACAQCHQEEHEGYVAGVHGVSQGLGISRAATCVDCHSGHAVKPVKQWSDDEKAARCAACHRGADPTFALAGVGHQEGGVAYYVERFLVVLTALVLGFGFLHVELDALRWAADQWRSRRRGGTGRR